MSVVDRALLKLFSPAAPTEHGPASSRAKDDVSPSAAVDTNAIHDASQHLRIIDTSQGDNSGFISLRFDVPSQIVSVATVAAGITDNSTTEGPASPAREESPDRERQPVPAKANVLSDPCAQNDLLPTEAPAEHVGPPERAEPEPLDNDAPRIHAGHERLAATPHFRVQDTPQQSDRGEEIPLDVSRQQDTQTTTKWRIDNPEPIHAVSEETPDNKDTDRNGRPDVRVFQAGFEVDRFMWPELCEALNTAAGTDFIRAARHILDIASEGANVVALMPLGDAKGCTTSTLCLARRLADLGGKVVVVDASFGDPDMARTLGIASDVGWDDPSAGQHDVRELLIESLGDKVTIAPLRGDGISRPTPFARTRWTALMQQLRERYDVVLVDSEPLAEANLGTSLVLDAPTTVDRAILLQGETPHADAELSDAVRTLMAAGIEPLGIVRNAHI